MTFVNLTPHEITMYVKHLGGDPEVIDRIPSSGEVARVTSDQTVTHTINGIPCVINSFGPVEGLPVPQQNTIYIVSSLVESQVSGRDDVYGPDTSPKGAVRNEYGQIIGCTRLVKF